MSEWQPIETAPKDGTAILGYWDIGSVHEYNFHAACFFAGSWWDPQHDHPFSPPTHWMPLPEAPR